MGVLVSYTCSLQNCLCCFVISFLAWHGTSGAHKCSGTTQNQLPAFWNGNVLNSAQSMKSECGSRAFLKSSVMLVAYSSASGLIFLTVIKRWCPQDCNRQFFLSLEFFSRGSLFLIWISCLQTVGAEQLRWFRCILCILHSSLPHTDEHCWPVFFGWLLHTVRLAGHFHECF